MTRNRMDRFIDGLELTAAIFIGIVAAVVFLTVTLRNVGLVVVILAVAAIAAAAVVGTIVSIMAVARRTGTAAASGLGLLIGLAFAAVAAAILYAVLPFTAGLRAMTIDIPDSYDFGMLLLGILIFWGIGATSYRGTHITVDLLWANVGPGFQRAIDVFATLVLLVVVTIHTYCLFDKVASTYAANISTFSLRLPTWPLFAVAWLGDAAAVLLIGVRTYRLIFNPEALAKPTSHAASAE